MQDVARRYAEITEELGAVQQSRSAFQLAHFVVARHGRIEDGAGPRMRLQALVELRGICQGIRMTEIEVERKRRELIRLEKEEVISQDPDLDREALLMQLDDLLLSHAAALREFEVLSAILDQLPQYTREEHDAHELRYWEQRLARQLVQNQIALNHGLDRGDVEAVHEAMRLPLVPVGCVNIQLPSPEDYMLPALEEEDGNS